MDLSSRLLTTVLSNDVFCPWIEEPWSRYRFFGLLTMDIEGTFGGIFGNRIILV